MVKNFLELYGKWALVIGGTSGIGEALTKQIAQKGMNLIIVARRNDVLIEKAEDIQKKYGVEVKTIQADLSAPNDYEKVIEGTKQVEVGLFIPAAGIENNGRMTNIDLQRELALLQLNVISTFILTRHFAREMESRGRGGILLIASLSAHMPNPYFANYAGSKSYILNLGNSLHWEMKKKGVNVTVLSPGLTATPMVADNGVDFSKTPMTPMSPDKVAEFALEGLVSKKPLVIPGRKNKMMAFMVKHFMSVSSSIAMGGKMIEKAITSEKL